MNHYTAEYQGKTLDVMARSEFEAQNRAALALGLPGRLQHLVKVNKS